MGSRRNGAAALVLGLGLLACGGGEAIDEVAVLTEACETQQGIGWLKREHGEAYCACWASEAKNVLSEENYAKFVEASAGELKAADEADREKIVRTNSPLYTTVSAAARSCARAG